jgi:hypothetical protein
MTKDKEREILAAVERFLEDSGLALNYGYSYGPVRPRLAAVLCNCCLLGALAVASRGPAGIDHADAFEDCGEFKTDIHRAVAEDYGLSRDEVTDLEKGYMGRFGADSPAQALGARIKRDYYETPAVES